MCVCVCVCWPDALSEKGEKKGRSLDNMNFQFGKGQDSSTYINLVVELGLGLGLGLHFSRFACFFANYFASHSPSGAASAASLEVPGGELPQYGLLPEHTLGEPCCGPSHRQLAFG